ncbi:MAG TPA: ATP-binding protein [Sedimentisphaerales bacterium]|nr:ATP-binding protein [Sedimentisphaerales bacterium]
MSKSGNAIAHRILVIDDNPSIHKDFQTILVEEEESTTLSALRTEVFGDSSREPANKSVYDLEFASQGKEGCEKVKQACSENRPYELAFVDMRMPPGWDGLKTIEHIWETDPNIQVVICTAYSDYSWGEISERLGRSENLLILKKPFDSAEVAQLASALTEKWILARRASLKTEQLEQMVKERTNELTRTNEQLEQEIAERREAERRQAELIEKVDSVNKELKDFASIVSHDLKAPLRGIKSLATWILDDCSDKLGEQGNEQIHLLLGRVERMYNLIDGVLQYSIVGRVEEQPTQVNLDQFVPEIIDMLVPPEHIKVTIENDMPVIEGEETQIMQLLQNLLSNAIKYNDKPEGWIRVGCVEEDGWWKFSVSDNGPGIENRHFERIFKMFQALSVTEEFEGTGVGLTVAKKIVELHGGKIWVESKVGEGSTFFFIWPKKEMGVKDAQLEANIAR